MDTKQTEALTLAQKLENAPAWESQSPTIYGWNDSGETLADAAAELRRLHSDYETLCCKLQTLEATQAQALDAIVDLAQEAHRHWDADRDAKVGKLLMALSGYSPGYDKRADALHATIAAQKGNHG